MKGVRVLGGSADGPVVALAEALSFWGGVDPSTGRIIDVHHPNHGTSLAGAVVLMPTSRGSCTGSGVLLELALNGRAPAAFVFCEPEDVLTLGALVASAMFERTVPVVRLSAEAYAAVARAGHARISPDALVADDVVVELEGRDGIDLALSPRDRAMRDGADGPAVQQAMAILVAMARQQGARDLLDVTRAHIDGCIYASPANLTFAEAMARLAGRVRVPTTMNAISVDRTDWQRQGVAAAFGEPAARLADAYVAMGCQPTYTCAPYLLPDAPGPGEAIGWSESNAVIYANSVLGARTGKHPDFLDLCIALTGRAPRTGVYLDEARRARLVIDVELPAGAGPAVWPLIGYLAGHAAPDVVPLLRGLAGALPSPDDLKSLCAAFGTTSAAPMLHIEGITPEADGPLAANADRIAVTRADLAASWAKLNEGPAEVDLVAIGSPHASLAECRALAYALAGTARHPGVAVIITAGRHVIAEAVADGTLARLTAARVQVFPDLCWCSISRPVFPPGARTVITTSGKYAHYGPGLSGCAVRLGTLADCVEAARTGQVPVRLPAWLS